MKMIREINDVCKEVLTILAYFNVELIEKIPDKVFKKLKEQAKDSKADFYIDTEKSLDEQNISEECKDLIALLYYNYVADEHEKNQLSEIWNKNENKYQEKLREKYNPDGIFQNNINEISKIENTSLANNSMIEYKKETIFDKIKKIIKNILKPIQ